jgi:hypothetical protein
MPPANPEYAGVDPTGGLTVTHHDSDHPEHIPAPDEPTVPQIEDDQTIAPRPEEEIADELRATPDVADHSQRSE